MTDPFLLVLNVYANISNNMKLVSQCRTAIQTQVGEEGFYSLRQGDPNNGFIDPNEELDVYFHYYNEWKIDSTELTMLTDDSSIYDLTDTT